MMTKIHANEERRTVLALGHLAMPFQHGLAALSSAISHYRTLRTLAPLPPERLRDCGIDPSNSRHESTSPDEARTMLSLMSMR